MLKIDGLAKSYAAPVGRRLRAVRDDEAAARVFAVRDVSLEVGEGEMFTLLGPSGCGKTTTLRAVAGLEVPDGGTIALDGRVLFSVGGSHPVNVPANERGLGMVFQSYAIWPHMSVFDNAAFPLTVMKRSRRPSKREIRERVERVLATMELEAYADRPATNLSGGQQQRLALARAIVVEPPLLLLDEPLSNLDAKLREALRYELKRLQRELGVTSVYVTHDQIEALALSSTIAVMHGGTVKQVGKPREIYEHPNSKFVAEFIGTSNFVSGVVVTRTGERCLVETAAGQLELESTLDLHSGQEVVVSVRPETITITTELASAVGPNDWRGVVVTRAYLGEALDHIVAIGDLELRVRGNPAVSVPPGTEVRLQLSCETFAVIPA